MPGHLTTTLSFQDCTVKINRRKPTTIIGERIHAAGRKKVLQALQSGNFDLVRQEAVTQVEAGAHILNINAVVPGIDESLLLPQVAQAVMEVVSVPLCFDSVNPKALEAALRIYPGKALVNSVNGEERSLQTILPVVERYKAAVIGLCRDDNGIPDSVNGRLQAAARIIERAGRFDIDPKDVIIDPLAMALGGDSHTARVTLETIRLLVEEFGVNICMGASNISSGLPDRKFINATFLAMAIHAGLTCPITNPLIPEIQITVAAADLIMDRDEQAQHWIQASQQRQKNASRNESI